MPNLIGVTLGGYRITKQIGLGGMATVYKAYQPSMNRYVALKLLSPHLAQDPNVVERFRQEAKVVAKLEHLHILPVYDHGEEDGYLFLVMRYIEAGTLKDRLARSSLSLSDVQRIVTSIGSALEYAHRLGVVHRDLKPSNILIDSQDDCYLTDFGIAKIVESTLGLTGSSVLGTPHYMAPEQCQSLAVDHRADIYAMGVMIYEMVTGQVPFDADTPFAVVIKHLSEPLPLPRSINPDLPEEVERVVLKALAKNPDDRYQSMRDLVADFDQVVQAVSPAFSAFPASITSDARAENMATVMSRRSQTWRQRLRQRPAWLLAAAGLLLVVLAALFLNYALGWQEWGGAPAGLGSAEATETAVALINDTPGAMVQPTSTSTSTPIPAPTLPPAPTTTPTATATATPIPSPTSTPSPTYTQTPRPTSTRTPTPVPDAVVITEIANVRAGPGLSYQIIDQVDNRDPVRITGRNASNDWLKVITPERREGWISASLLELNVALVKVAVATIPPTPTSSLAEQTQAFAEPILAAITGRPPDYQDDFNNPGSGWEISQEERGERGYKDGKYFVRSTITSSANGDWFGPAFSDFVLEVEAQFVSGESGNWFVVLRDWRAPNPRPHGFYGVQGVLQKREVYLYQWVNPADGENVFLLPPAPVLKPGYETNRVMVIFKGSQMALYVNGQPVGLASDDLWPRGTIGLAAGTESDATPLEVHYDNLKVWDISNLTLP